MQLKPPCVELSQVALRFQAKKAAAKDIITALESLLRTLKTVTKQDHALDSKLAEYAFFPLSHIFRESKSIPVRALELALQCLQILISRGWRSRIPLDLSKQLLILLTFLAGGSATEARSREVNEEVGAIAYACLTSLLKASDAGGLSVKGSIDSNNFPILGHSVSVLLDGTSNGPSPKVRMGALNALDTLVSNVSDQEALKNFFPGIVSSLTKLLSGNRSKGPFKILQGSIQVLDKLLLKVISDDALPETELSRPHDATLMANKGRVEKAPWLKATSSQLKQALVNILPLRYHDREEVRTALFQLCMSILERCRKSLSQSVPMMVEATIVICTQSSEVDAVELMNNMNMLMTGGNDLSNILKSSLRDWLIALPRIMQSPDDLPKKRTVDQISMAFKLMGPQSLTFNKLDDVAIANLLASVSAAIQASASKTIQDVPETSQEVSQLIKSSPASASRTGFPEVLFNKTNQKTTAAGLEALVYDIISSTSSLALRRDIIQSLHATSGDEQLASLWLALQFSRTTESSSNDFDGFIHRQPNNQDAQTFLLEDIYSFSLSVLSKPIYDTEVDWRLQALSLQAVTLQARQQGSGFRPELVDALYPILGRLGSTNAALQHQAITALNLVSNTCEYPSPRELIIENVDYLVNDIALRLNNQDISPQVPQVLVMMLQLCGARLIPYLDDLVENIFTILEHYHGYPKLVESMFSVLGAIVKQQNKASKTAITDKSEPIRSIRTYQPPTIADLAAHLRERLMAKPPLEPLSSPTSSPDPEADASSSGTIPQNPPSDETPPLPNPLQTITRIANLTQHHLATPSSSLRLLLLRLLLPTFAPLSHHQDTLLPLINVLWPVLITRLYDPEPYITIAACEALIGMCRTAGDFMASRFEGEWGKILKLAREKEREMLVERKAMGRGRVGERVWWAVMGLVGAVVEWVGLTGEMEDCIWGLVGEGLERGDGDALRVLRRVLEGLNADMLWLVEERVRVKKGGEVLERPVFEGVEFPEIRV